MNKYFAHIKSNIPASVSANGEYLGVSSKRSPIDILVTNKDLYLNIFPIGNYSSYTAHISNINTCIDTTNNTIVVPYYNNHFDIYLNHSKVYTQTPTTTLLNTTLGNIVVNILNGINSSIAIYENNIMIYSDIVDLLSSAVATIENKNIIIKGHTNSNKYYILILNDKYEILYSGYFDGIEEQSNKIVGLTHTYDMAKHCHICEIDKASNNVQDYYIIKENVNMCDCEELIPRAFLEALKVGNFELAKKYLLESLSKASNSHFKTFFGDIQSIYYNAYNNSNPVNYTVYSGTYKSYNFQISQNKIIDIEEVTF